MQNNATPISPNNLSACSIPRSKDKCVPAFVWVCYGKHAFLRAPEHLPSFTENKQSFPGVWGRH